MSRVYRWPPESGEELLALAKAHPGLVDALTDPIDALARREDQNIRATWARIRRKGHTPEGSVVVCAELADRAARIVMEDRIASASPAVRGQLERGEAALALVSPFTRQDARIQATRAGLMRAANALALPPGEDMFTVLLVGYGRAGVRDLSVTDWSLPALSSVKGGAA